MKFMILLSLVFGTVAHALTPKESEIVANLKKAQSEAFFESARRQNDSREIQKSEFLVQKAKAALQERGMSVSGFNEPVFVESESRRDEDEEPLKTYLFVGKNYSCLVAVSPTPGSRTCFIPYRLQDRSLPVDCFL